MLLTSAGCTVVHIDDAGGRRTEIVPGSGHDLPADRTSVTAYKRKTFGFGIQRDGVVIGWSEERAVRAGDLSQCRVVIFDLPEDPEEAGRWRELIIARPDVCLVEKGKADAVR